MEENTFYKQGQIFGVTHLFCGRSQVSRFRFYSDVYISDVYRTHWAAAYKEYVF